MGMFDYVEYEANCWRCGTPVSEWQTKDTGCTMITVRPEECLHFYGICHICKTWNEYAVKPTAFVIVPADKRDLSGCCETCRRPFAGEGPSTDSLHTTKTE